MIDKLVPAPDDVDILTYVDLILEVFYFYEDNLSTYCITTSMTATRLSQSLFAGKRTDVTTKYRYTGYEFGCERVNRDYIESYEGIV